MLNEIKVVGRGAKTMRNLKNVLYPGLTETEEGGNDAPQLSDTFIEFG